MCFIGFPQHSFFHSTELLTDCSNVGIYSHFNACVVERGVLTDEELSKLGTWDGSESVMPHKGLQGEPRANGPGDPGEDRLQRQVSRSGAETQLQSCTGLCGLERQFNCHFSGHSFGFRNKI